MRDALRHMALWVNSQATAATTLHRSQPREGREASGKPGNDRKLVDEHLMDNACRPQHGKSSILQKSKLQENEEHVAAKEY
jgi:hypothetical protein